MTQEDVEIVRGHIAAFRAQDAPRALSFLDPHIVMDVSRAGGIDSGAFYGYEALTGFMRRYAGTFEDYAYEVERLTDLDRQPSAAAVAAAGVAHPGEMGRHSPCARDQVEIAVGQGLRGAAVHGAPVARAWQRDGYGTDLD
jgi:hypothetical protein